MILSVLRTARRSVQASTLTFVVGILTCLQITSGLNAYTQRMYFIGNSFTWDAQPNNLSTATTYPHNLDPTIGWSIFSGKSLTYIVDNPDKFVTEVAFVAADYYPDPDHNGNYETDLTTLPWDAISIQPHTYDGGLYLYTEIEAANTIIAKLRENPETLDTVVYIFGSWAFQQPPDKSGDRDYSGNWLQNYSESHINNGLLPNVYREFRSLYWEPLKEQNPDVTIKWIPVGEVLYQLDQELKNGTIPGLSGTWDLFDQYGVHLHDTDENNIAGRYISHITTLCTIWGSDPSGFKTKYEGVIDPDFKALVDQVVWDTVLELYPDIEACPLQEQTITFPALPDTYILDESLPLLASSNSGLDVTYEILEGPATISGDTLEFLGSGEVTIQATQAGNGEWCPATKVEQTFTIYSIADNWRLQNLGTYENEGDASNLADPDFDNIPNLFEYFLGTSPTSYDSNIINPLMTLDPGNNYQAIQSANSVEGLEVWFEWSQNLIDWASLPHTYVNISENLLGDRYYSIDTSGINKPHFIRLRLSPQVIK